jgi:hypothetical protein
MSFRHITASTLLALTAVSIGGSTLSAQLSSRGTSLLVPIAGVADQAGTFTGALLVEQFASQSNGVAALGTITGTLTVNGTIRNIVMQVTLPLDVEASRARLSTDPALSQASCDALHMELGGTSVNVLGFTIGLNPVAFDIASALQAGSPSTPTPAAAPSTTSAAQPGTVTPSVSTNTTQPGAAAPSSPGDATGTPGVAPQAPRQPAAPQGALGSALCSVDHFKDVSSPTKLAQQLNGILTALGGTQNQQNQKQ